MTLGDALLRPRTSNTPVLASLVPLFEIFARPRTALSPSATVLGSFLSVDPPIFYCNPQPRPFGAASYFARRYPAVPFIFLTPITYSRERPIEAISLAAQYHRFRRAHPRARLIVLANTTAEESVLGRFGVEVQLANQNMFVEEALYRPVPGRPRRFDAIYNAQLAPIKRHDLARMIPTCAYVTKLFGPLSRSVKRRRLAAFVDGLPPGHELLNGIGADDVMPMNHLEVNDAMASAHVGLCLSPVEGAMYVSIEYLLAGLPVVSTRSRGGRDVFFHPDTAVMVADDPREVRDAVAALKARAIPPDAVRATTLRLVERERERFNVFIESLTGRRAGSDARWSFDFHHKLVAIDPTLSALERHFGAGPHGGSPVIAPAMLDAD